MRIFYLKKYLLLSALLIIPYLVFAQTGSITGKVTDENKMPIPGATVTVVGSSLSTATGNNGEYAITGIKSGKYTVEVKFIGYVTMQSLVNVSSGNVPVNFNLRPDSKGLNEVVVIGYGTAKKKDLTGSVTTITSKDFNQGPITTPEQLIQGKVAGVQITSNGGAPGSGSTIRIRGGASLNASNDPLIVIDGVPVSNNTIAGASNPLSSINPDDIESETILKDASATAIFGSRASNGVIIITTKKGKSAALQVTFNSLNSLSNVTKEVPVLTADQFRSLVKADAAASGSTAQSALLGNANTDWQKQIYRNAWASDNDISFSGGIKGLPYRLSLGYLDQDGVLKTSNLKRTSVALNLNKDLFNNSLKIDLNLKGTYSQSRFADQGAIGSAVNFDPTQPVYSGNSNYGGYYEWISGGAPNTLAPRNPLGLLEEKWDLGAVKRSIGNVQFNYIFPFLKDLKANVNFGYDASHGQGSTLVPATAASAFAQKGSYDRYSQDNLNYVSDYYLNYIKDIKSIDSHIDLTAGYSYQYFENSAPLQQFFAADQVTGTGKQPQLAYKNYYYIESTFARLNYTLADKYLLTATVRRDGSSRFSPENRYGVFPSVSLAWRINRESFLKDSKVISDFKLRASYGQTGQQDIGPYFPYLARYTFGDTGSQYQFGNAFTTTLRPEGYDPNIKWETTTTSNIGLDYGFLNGRITGTIDYYSKKTKDLLADIPVADGSGLTNHLFTNVGNMESKGAEFAINAVAVSTKDVKWNIGYNVTYNEVTLTNLSKTGKNSNVPIGVGNIPGGVGNTIQAYLVGATPNAFLVNKQVYDANGKPLEGVYVDINHNGVFDAGVADRYIYKQPNPKFFMGFNSSVDYKKWTLGFSMRANLGNYIYNAFAASTGATAGFKFPNYLGNLSSSVLNTNFQKYQLFSDYYVENGSFLRMDNANLSYNFGKILDGKARLRVSANVSNVFVITKYTGLDPEVQGGIDNNFYPRPRVFAFGLNLGF